MTKPTRIYKHSSAGSVMLWQLRSWWGVRSLRNGLGSLNWRCIGYLPRIDMKKVRGRF